MAVRAVIQFHNSNPKEYKQTYHGTILVFVPGKSEINLVIKMITDLQNRGHTANLYPYGFHAELSMKDKDMLTKYPIEDRDEEVISQIDVALCNCQPQAKIGVMKELT